MRTYYKPGDYVAICDMCGVKRHASSLRSVFVAGKFSHKACSECWERDHPGNIPPRIPISEGQPPPWTRPDKTPEAIGFLILESEDGGLTVLEDGTGVILLE